LKDKLVVVEKGDSIALTWNINHSLLGEPNIIYVNLMSVHAKLQVKQRLKIGVEVELEILDINESKYEPA
jgi:hypothetical protein